MSTIAELTVPAEEFALRRTLESFPDVNAEIERVVAYDPDHVMPYVWISTDDGTLEGIDQTLEEDRSAESFELLTDLEDERLYRMDWIEDVVVMIHVLTEEQATILDASGERSHWRLRILFPEREALARTYDFTSDQELTVNIEKVHQMDEDRHGRHGLTDTQHETLVAALEAGYYQIPRDADMEALSGDLDVSHQALSERLRRAHRVLVEDAIAIGPEDERNERWG